MQYLPSHQYFSMNARIFKAGRSPILAAVSAFNLIVIATVRSGPFGRPGRLRFSCLFSVVLIVEFFELF